MNHKTNCAALLTICVTMFLSAACYACTPWVCGLNLAALDQANMQPEGVTITAGDGHVIVDFSEAATEKQPVFVDPMNNQLQEPQTPLYNVAALRSDSLRACLKACDRLADLDDYIECVDWCHEVYGRSTR